MKKRTEESIGNYFPSLDTTLFDWVRNLFTANAYDNAQLTTVEENYLSDDHGHDQE